MKKAENKILHYDYSQIISTYPYSQVLEVNKRTSLC